MDWTNHWSTVYAYCVDSETGANDSYEICSGWMFYGSRQNEEHLDSSGKWPLFYSDGEVLDIDTNGVAQISYIYYLEFADQYIFVEGIEILLPPDPEESNNNLSGDIYCNSNIRSDVEEVFEILSNPVWETLDVRLLGVSGDTFELLLYDIFGRQILSESGILRDDESVLNIGVQDLPSGVFNEDTNWRY